MMNMIKADSYRTFRSVAIYVGIAIMLLMMGVSLYMCEPGMISMALSVDGESLVPELESPTNSLSADVLENMTVGEQREYIISVGGYQLDRDIVSKNMNLYYIFIFAVTTAITVDFTTGAVKNTLSSNTSKGKYFASKTVFAIGLCTLIHFANIYLTYFVNLLANGRGLSSGLLVMTRVALLQLPVMIALASVLTGLSFVLRRALVTAIEVPLMMLCQILMAVVIRLCGLSGRIMNYDFQYMISALAKQPSGSYIVKCYILCGAVCAVFLAAGWLSFRRAEVK